MIWTAGLPVIVAGCTSDNQRDRERPTKTKSPTPSTECADGCPSTEVAVGPNGTLRFEPEEVTVDAGATVRWEFKTPGHNVSSRPAASERCENPPDADPFASYSGDTHTSLNAQGTSFEHRFTQPGTYVYVCVPHVAQGMVGSVTVTG